MTHDIDYEVRGNDMQPVEIRPGEPVIAEAGTVYLQSLSFSRLARRVLQQLPQGSRSKGEGPVPGGLGNPLSGDNR